MRETLPQGGRRHGGTPAEIVKLPARLRGHGQRQRRRASSSNRV